MRRRRRRTEYAIEREIEVTEVTGDKISVVVRSDYGKSDGCSPARTPASCKHEATMTFALKEKFCEPDCVAEVRAASQDSVEKTGCRCPNQ